MISFQALQNKHDALLRRVDELDNECEELRERVLETEGERDELQGVLEDLQTEKKNLSEELDSKQVILTLSITLGTHKLLLLILMLLQDTKYRTEQG